MWRVGAMVWRHVDVRRKGCRIEQQIRQRRVRRVTGEQRGHPRIPCSEHEAAVLDAWILVRREHGDLDRTYPQPLPGGHRATRHSGACRALGPEAAERHVLETARLDREANFVASEHRKKAGTVIGVRVREDHGVDAALPGREAPAKQGEQAPRVRTAVDEHDCTPVLEEEGIALPHVEGTQS